MWPLQDAKARFSELVRRAVEEGPQRVSVRGAPTAVVLSEHDYQCLLAKTPTIVDYILEGESWPDDLVETINDRSRSADRGFDF